MFWRSTMVKRSPGATAVRAEYSPACTLAAAGACCAQAGEQNAARRAKAASSPRIRLPIVKPRPLLSDRGAVCLVLRSPAEAGCKARALTQRRRSLDARGARQDLRPQAKRQEVRVHDGGDAL